MAVRFPDGRVLTGAAAQDSVGAFLGRAVTLERSPGHGPAFVDEADLHLVSLAELADWPVRRFRPNLVLDIGGPLEELVGERLRIGAARLEIVKRTKRCASTTCGSVSTPVSSRRVSSPSATRSRFERRASA